jgi:hypothetical protein
MPLTLLVFSDSDAKRETGICGFGFVARRWMLDCAEGWAVA